MHNLFITRTGWKFHSGKPKQLIKKIGLQMRKFVTHRFLSRDTRNQQGKKGNQAYNLSLSLSLSPLSLLDIFQPPLCGILHPFYKHFSFSYLSNWPTPCQNFWRFLSHPLLVTSPIFIMKLDFWGYFVLFKLSYEYLMWKILGREPLINVKVTTSMILIFLGGWWSW